MRRSAIDAVTVVPKYDPMVMGVEVLNCGVPALVAVWTSTPSKNKLIAFPAIVAAIWCHALSDATCVEATVTPLLL